MNNENKYLLKEGYVCYYENCEEILADLDGTFKNLLNGIKYKEFAIPALIDGEVLEKCGYFESFPDQITVVGEIAEESLNDVMNGEEIDTSCVKLRGKYLTPSACLHVYPMLQGRKIEENTVITLKARVYRNEKDNFSKMTRLWDFSVREIVFIGTKEFVQEMLNEMKMKALELAKEISPKAKLVVAHDHFYKSQRNDIKSRIQSRNELKHELIISINGEDVSVGSFNFHDTHFSIPFDFDDDRKIVTGCVGFGLERWVAASLFYNKQY